MRKLLILSVFMAVGVALAIFIVPGRTQALNANHDCSYCHDVHGASQFQLLREEIVETLCLTCHGPAGISTLKADVHTNDTNSQYPAFRISCTGCHDSHDDRANWLGGTNIRLVGRRLDGTGLAKIDTPNNGIQNTVFESRGTSVGDPSIHSFADGDEDGNGVYDGICEVCHTLTRNHRNNPSGNHSHQVGRTCTRCHEHVTNFIP
jgi:predicted CXXCH cytochrome family protein